jgi:N-carbamoyl-L-amino-acid hydrolase
LGLKSRKISHTDPVRIPKEMQSAVRNACALAGIKGAEIVSGAGHDANQMALLAPAGMIFVPSTGGVSHCPEEYTPVEQILRGTEVLLRTLLLLDERIDSAN